MYVFSLGMRYKSYNIMYMLLYRVYRDLGINGMMRLVDLTYGRGRFYRRFPRGKLYIVAVDPYRHEWEVEPDEYHQVTAAEYVDSIIHGGGSTAPDVNVIVVDPPWSHEKRGVFPRYTGISSMPYHQRGVNSIDIIRSALRLREHYGVPLIYRYKEPITGTTVLVKHNIVFMRNKGTIYYGIIM